MIGETSHYRLGPVRFSEDTMGLQAMLARAHEDHVRPLCQCCRAEPPMYVARINGTYHLKRMPGTGHLHALSCLSFDPPAELSGLGPLAGHAIVADEAGGTLLKLDFALSERGGRGAAMREERDTELASVCASPGRLGLRALLHYLWEAAGLTRWRKVYQRRSWWVVQRELLFAAAQARVRGGPLAGILFVPHPYAVEEKERLAVERRRFLHRFQPVEGKPTPLGLLIAELKGFEPAQYGRRIRLKHLPDFPVFMDTQTAKRFDRLASERIRLVEATQNSHVIVISTFAARGAYADIREIAVMAVNARWIPFEGERDHALLEALAGRDHIRCLSYNLPANAPIATAVLLDGTEPTALYAPASTMTAEREEAMRQVARDGLYAAWHWPADAFEMPALPAEADHARAG